MRLKLTVVGLILAGLSLGFAVHASENSACPTVPSAKGVSADYDRFGRLSYLHLTGKNADDAEEEIKQQVRFTYTPHISDILHTGVTVQLKAPNKRTRGKNNSVHGPIRNSEYDSKTGDLMRVNTYEKMKVNAENGNISGYQTSFEIPVGVDVTKLPINDKGNVVYTGAAELVTIPGDRKPFLNKEGKNEHELTLTEPLNIRTEKCYSFAGALFPLNLPAVEKPAMQPKISGQPKDGIKRIGNRIETPEGYIELHESEDEESIEMLNAFSEGSEAGINVQ